jgi:hypothetical protein
MWLIKYNTTTFCTWKFIQMLVCLQLWPGHIGQQQWHLFPQAPSSAPSSSWGEAARELLLSRLTVWVSIRWWPSTLARETYEQTSHFALCTKEPRKNPTFQLSPASSHCTRKAAIPKCLSVCKVSEMGSSRSLIRPSIYLHRNQGSCTKWTLLEVISLERKVYSLRFLLKENFLCKRKFLQSFAHSFCLTQQLFQ